MPGVVQLNPESVLYDADGNPVGVASDGSIYRLQSDSKIAKGASDLVHLDAIDVSSGIGRLKSTLYSQDGEAIALNSVASNPAAIKNNFLLNGTSSDMRVNGSVTPVVFSYDADPNYDISLQELTFIMTSNAITFGTDYFGAVAGPLPNGVLVEITAGGYTGTVINMFQNECFVVFASPGGFQWIVSSKDLMSSTFVIGGGLKLEAGSSDKVQVTIRDNLSSVGSCFKGYVKGNLLGS